MHKKNAPHVAILNIQLLMCHKLPTGEISGSNIASTELANYNIPTQFIIQINGKDRFDCIRKVQDFIKDANKL